MFKPKLLTKFSKKFFSTQNLPFKIGKLNHVAIAVPNLKQSTEFYKNVMNAKVSEPLDQPEHGVTVVFIELENTKFELLHPLGTNSPIANFLQKNQSVSSSFL
jgi:methylmalonyl-CoA/ethylmalonyl-CoA epimerase